MPDRQDRRMGRALGSIGTAALAIGAGVVGCGTSTGSAVSDTVRQKINDAATAGPRPTSSPSRTYAAGGPDVEPVRRFAVRPFEEWTMRETAAAALGRIGKAAVPKLIESLKSPNPALRHQAADTLARIGPSAAEAVPALIQTLDDEDPLVRKASARALGQVGPDAAEAVPKLIELLLEDERKP